MYDIYVNAKTLLEVALFVSVRMFCWLSDGQKLSSTLILVMNIVVPVRDDRIGSMTGWTSGARPRQRFAMSSHRRVLTWCTPSRLGIPPMLGTPTS